MGRRMFNPREAFMKKIFLLLPVVVLLSFSQATDSTIVFESPNKDIVTPIQSEMHDAWGVDILLSNNGFGLAGFYRREFSRDLFGTVTLGIAESKDDNEVEIITYWGESIIFGKINRFLFVPLHVGVQYRLFADDITDSFRPYVNAGFGPSLILAAPYVDQTTGEQIEYFRSLGLARAHYTVGGYVGFGAFFGSDMGSLSGINIRYYFVPVAGGIPSLMEAPSLVDPNRPRQVNRKKDFGGFFITINLGSVF